MEGLFAKELPDLGPWGLDPLAVAPVLTRVQGKKTAELRRQIREICPGKPGVYAMIDATGEIIYVGKAKLLRTRLFSYFRAKGRPPKATKILKQASSIVWEVVPSEFAALQRELELIRRWRPRWNVQGQPLRRRLTFVCVGRRPAPYVFLAREPPRTALAIHGPISAGPSAQEAVRALNDLFRLRDCPQAQEMIFPEQGHLFPIVHPAGCLRVEIGTCLGPCTGTCSRGDYQQQVDAVRAFLKGRDVSVLDLAQRKMLEASTALNFEGAAAWRDRLERLSWLYQRLEHLRHARERMSFIYPVTGWDHGTMWYLIHGGRTVAALRAPHDMDSALQAVQRIEEVYQSKKLALLLDTYEHVDSRLLVTSWFRKYPAELKKTLEPGKALDQCRHLAE